MGEFGEQLRKAREAKGMTQQTLAEHLYVTRQAVSRWECGDRYPDLIMAKKLAAFLEVSLDDLVSTDEMKKVAERNQIIEKPFMKHVLIILYACISLSFLFTAVDIIMRFPITSTSINYSDIQLIAVNLLGLLIQIIVFAYGFILALQGTLTPKKTGISMALYFVSLCLTNSYRMTYSGFEWKNMIAALLLMAPCLLGAAAAYQYFYAAETKSVWYWSLIAVSGWEIFRVIWNTYSNIRWAAGFVSMNTALNLLLKIGIYFLIIYQACIMKQKREQFRSAGRKDVL